MLAGFSLALRLLLRAPAFTAAAILTLALGIGVTVAVFTVVNAVLLRPLPFPEPERLVVLSESHLASGQDRAGVLPGSFLDWRERSRGLDAIAMFWNEPTLVTNRPDPVRITAANVSPNFFELMSVRPLIGRAFPATDAGLAGHEREIVIGFSLWQRWFGGDPGVLGKTLEVQGRVPLTIVGVMPAEFGFPRGADFWKPQVWTRGVGRGEVERFRKAVGRVATGATIDTARRELQQIEAQLAREFPKTNEGWTVAVDPLFDALTAGVRAPLAALLAAVALVFLNACINVATLVMQRGLGRQRELATRLALGASWPRLVRESLFEHGLLTAAGLAAGSFLAFTILNLLAVVMPPDIPRLNGLILDWRVIACMAAIALVSIAITGMLPVLLSRRVVASAALGGSTSSRGVKAGWRALVIAQVTVAVALLASAGLMVRTMMNLQRLDIGFELSGMAAADLSLPLSRVTPDGSQRPQWDRLVLFYNRVIESVEGVHGIRSAALVATPSFAGRDATWLARPGLVRPQADGSPEWRTIQRRAVTPRYFEVMRQRLLRGRPFTDHDHALEYLRTGKGRRLGVAVVNSAAARHFWPGGDPLGKTLTIAGESRVSGRTVVAIADDARDISPDLAAQPTIYVPFGESPDFNATLLVRTSTPEPPLASLRARLRSNDSLLMIDNLRLLADSYADTIATRRFVAVVLIVFAALGLLLSVVGLYGLIAGSVTRRLREFAVRAALGATPRGVQAIVLRDAALTVAAGGTLGVFGAQVGARLLQSQLFGVDALDASIWIGTLAILAIVILAAAWWPARRASRSDPAAILRAE